MPPSAHLAQPAVGKGTILFQATEVVMVRLLSSQCDNKVFSALSKASVTIECIGENAIDVHIGNYCKEFVSMCLKTLRAVPSAQQERGWVNNLPKFNDGSVIPRIYFKLGK